MVPFPAVRRKALTGARRVEEHNFTNRFILSIIP